MELLPELGTRPLSSCMSLILISHLLLIWSVWSLTGIWLDILVLFRGVFSGIFGEGSMLLSSPNPDPISD